jgi:two-component system, LytTR family, sensor kinase
MITGLSELLRLALDGSGRQEVPLRQELDFVTRYLDIERTRFQDRLRVVNEVDPGTFNASVPNLILQPIVENAIRHGIAPRAAEGTVTIRARRAGDRLAVTVADDGVGLREGWQPGVGLGNVRARLAHLYPERHRVAVESRPEGGTLVTLEVPFREETHAD